MSVDATWAVTFLALGVVWVGIAAWWTRRERRRRMDEPAWWERDIRYRQQDREIRESEPHGWSH